MRSHRIPRVALLLVLTSAALPSLAAAQAYRVTETSIAIHEPDYADINDQRQLVVALGRLTFIWDPVHGPRSLGLYTSGPVHINNRGVIAGVDITRSPASPPRPFLWIDGNVSTPPTPPLGVGSILAFTDRGIMLMEGVGTWLLNNGVLTNLSALGFTAYAVNDSLMVGGWMESASPRGRPFLRFPDGRVIDPWPYEDMAVVRIGPGGHFYGWGRGDFARYGTPDGQTVQLPWDRYLEDINRAGDAVGYALPGIFPNAPFLYRGGRFNDLNALIDRQACGCTLLSAQAISDAGYIVATARFDSPSHRGDEVVVLEPTIPAVPTGLVFEVTNRVVNLFWNESPSAIDYILQAGTSSGASNLFNGSIGMWNSLVTAAPPGRYYVRVLARNALGVSRPSNEVVIDVR